jgi:hypothetical protein
MFKQALSALAVVTAGAGLALGQDATSAGSPASRLQTPIYSTMNANGQTVYSAEPLPSGTTQQTAADTAPPPAAAIVAAPSAGCSTCGNCPAKDGLHGWFTADYMLLFPSRQHVPTLLVDPTGAPLAGNSPDIGISSGIRINAGMWLLDGQIATQAIAFGTIRSTVTATAAAGSIPLTGAGLIPVTNYTYNSWHQLAGGEGNSLYRLIDNDATKVYVLGGTKYVSLEEDITQTYNVGGNFTDEFHTRNQFVGGQVGAVVTHHQGRFDFDATAKVALGVNYTQLFVLGSNDAGLNFQTLTQRSNIGYFESSYFGVIPEADVNVHYRLTQRLSVNAGYTFMMSVNNWRPGDQIQTTFIPAPIVPLARSTYFVHGLTAGLTFNY